VSASAGPAGLLEEPVLDIRGLCVEYGRGGQATRAVIDADLALHRGEVLGLAGESGSGKSTLAYGATRLLRQPGIVTGGRVLFSPSAQYPDSAIDILDASPQTLRSLRWRDVAVVFQSAMNSLNPVLSVQAQLTDTLAAHLPQSAKYERRERAVELLHLVGISEDRLRAFPHELSGGMKQRVMIALALALDPQIVIMDEPTTALDVVTQRQIVEQVIRLRDRFGFSVLFITHDLSLLIEMADIIAIMYAGRIVESAPAQRLFRAPRHPYTAALLDSFPSLHGEPRVLTGIPGSPPDMRSLPAGCPFAARCRYALPRCTDQLPPLTSPAIGSGSRRLVACWLHEQGELPGELAAPETDGQPRSAGSRPLPVAPESSGGPR
jgi:peptide/nickel transport system ATP-binding protein